MLGSEQWDIILKVLSIFNYFLIMAICTICGLVTEYMKLHMSNHGDERNFECDKCEKACIGYKALVNHKKSHMTWNCTNCD